MNHSTSFTVGMDVSDRNSVLCVLDNNAEILEEARIGTKQTDLERWFGSRAAMRVVLEVGPHSPWMARQLEQLGHEVIVANPRQLRLVFGNIRKSDRRDAENLARLGCLDPSLLHPIQHRSESAQTALAVARSRQQLVRARAALITHCRAVAKTVGERLPSGSSKSFHRHASLVPDELQAALLPLFQTIEMLTRQIAEYDKSIKALCEKDFPETQALMEVNGVGPNTALTFVATIDDASRFTRNRDVGAYLGLVPRRDQSGMVDKQLPITKAGDRNLRTLLVQCAQRILSTRGRDSDLRRWGLRLMDRGGARAKKRAVVAVARKLAVLLLSLLKSGEVYEPLRDAVD